MNPILLVIPILSVLMFDLGLTLTGSDFTRLMRQPRAVLVGLAGQLILLPLVAAALVLVFRPRAEFALGFVLLACCPGGSSSNIFSKLAGGNVALSVTMTALSSVLTLFTLPVLMDVAVDWIQADYAGIHLPVGNLVVQNIVLMALPILLGIAVRRLAPRVAAKTDRVLSRLAFPALMLLAGIFFVQHHATIGEHIGSLGLMALLLIVTASTVGAFVGKVTGLEKRERRTIVIEIGMQNAAQAIAIATSPFVLANEVVAIPAVIYALIMNVVLLCYVGVIRLRA